MFPKEAKVGDLYTHENGNSYLITKVSGNRMDARQNPYTRPKDFRSISHDFFYTHRNKYTYLPPTMENE